MRKGCAKGSGVQPAGFLPQFGKGTAEIRGVAQLQRRVCLLYTSAALSDEEAVNRWWSDPTRLVTNGPYAVSYTHLTAAPDRPPYTAGTGLQKS